MNEAVSKFVEQLDSPEKEIVSLIRGAILESNDEITEQIKWNAPSFCFGGEDRVTFRLKMKDRSVQLIFHRGAKVKDASDFSFEDSSGLLEWAAADRAILKLKDPDDAKAKKSAVVKVVNEWVKATA
jgi:hypothetical protein